jgi:branched-chain amino acid transport system permease protein
VQSGRTTVALAAAGLVVIVIAPYVFYPLFLIKVICFCLFACAYKLAMGTAGLLSFGHAAFFGGAAYIAAHAAKVWGAPFACSWALPAPQCLASLSASYRSDAMAFISP